MIYYSYVNHQAKFIETKVIFQINLNLVIFRRRQWQPTPVLLTGKSHGRRSLVGCRPWGR